MKKINQVDQLKAWLTFMNQRGFHDIQNVMLEDLKPLYFTGSNAGRVLPKCIDIVSARVSKDSPCS